MFLTLHQKPIKYRLLHSGIESNFQCFKKITLGHFFVCKRYKTWFFIIKWGWIHQGTFGLPPGLAFGEEAYGQI